MKTIYLDNAATSFPKPPSVIRAVVNTIREHGGNPGRSSHRLARRASELLYACREEIATLTGLSDPTRVILTKNATEALNVAVKGFLSEGDHVLISDLEHNSVLRPVHQMSRGRGVTYSIFESARLTGPDGVDAALAPLLSERTRAIITTHASNICSRTLPVGEIGAFCKRHGILLIVDASQSIGHLPIHMEEMQIDALCAPGHKGLYGPQGSGFLLLSSSLPEEALPRPLTEGGSGYASLLREMPPLPPERYEAGTLATPAFAGLTEGIRFVKCVGIDAIREHEEALGRIAVDQLSVLRGITLYGAETAGAVLSFSVAGHPAEEVADHLDGYGICVRPGFHCAALAHETLGTPTDSGAVRLSFGYFNTEKEICTAVRRIRELL